MWTAPAVLGHPETDSPAHGWVSSLARESDLLKAKFENVSADLEGLVQRHAFPNRSAAFYRDPKGSGPVLRHVGFLGARPPEVKGLQPVRFSDGDFVAIELRGGSPMPESNRVTHVALFGEIRGAVPTGGDGGGTLLDGRGTPIDPESMLIHSRAMEIYATADQRGPKGEAGISYGDALKRARAEIAAKKAAEQRGIQFSEGGCIPVEPASEELSRRASEVMVERGITFGEALRVARRLA